MKLVALIMGILFAQVPTLEAFIPTSLITPSQLSPSSLQHRHAATRTEQGLEEAAAIVQEAQTHLRPAFEEVDRRTQRTLKRILTSFRKHQVEVEDVSMMN